MLDMIKNRIFSVIDARCIYMTDGERLDLLNDIYSRYINSREEN